MEEEEEEEVGGGGKVAVVAAVVVQGTVAHLLLSRPTKVTDSVLYPYEFGNLIFH